MIQILIEGKDISRYVIKDGFPDEIEYSVKGEGYFDFEVRPFSFKVLTPIILKDGALEISTGQKAEVKIRETGEILLKGIVDSIEDAENFLKEITLFPDALLLKDTIVGEEVDIGEDEPARDFCPGETLSVREIVRRVLEYVNSEKGSNFTVDESTCPDPGTTKGSFFGNILKREKRSGLVFGLWNIIADVLNLNYRFHFRKKDGRLYLIESDAGFFFKRIWEKGEWIKWKLQIPPKKVLGIGKGAWVNFTLEMPPFDIRFPTIGAKFHVYRCIGGGLEKVETQEFFPLPPFYDFSFNLDKYGNKVCSRSCQNVSNSKVKAFLKEKKYVPESIEIISAVDLDERNSYFYVDAQKENKLLEHEDVLLSFETMSDFYYYVHYRNAKAIEIIKDLCKVTDRWFKVDFSGRVYLLPVAYSRENTTIPEKKILSISRRREKTEDFNLNLNRLIEDENGVSSYGIRLRKAEFEALERYYQRKLEREREVTEFKILNARIDLLDNCQFGKVVEIKRSLKEPIMEIKAELYDG
ncbi:MAG: hypothetical protein H0Z28_11235 [Archaeoglobus sp.]|nr:hypothetical protein [Archaeoglobus sp.]